MLNHIQQPEYRQLIVELLTIVFTILGRNPELTFTQPLDLEQLIKDAAHMYAKVKSTLLLCINKYADVLHKNNVKIFILGSQFERRESFKSPRKPLCSIHWLPGQGCCQYCS